MNAPRVAGHQLLYDPLRSRGRIGPIGNGRRYDDLLRHAVEIEVERGFVSRVLDLETLIVTKEETGQGDLAALPLSKERVGGSAEA